ncbi:MAG: elongation factor G [Candidatus Omnitrophica bacterium]|nr:elongation factor G [Candidatus Omnitrophota bacterium]MBU4478246.1 elongation factor G [Candidatus Omnitrophota bacterium]MCG2703314.1 elongation factor G [Candidatus Omnitrophota bacterium]
MERYAENMIRNVVFVSHSGAGKTTLVDSMLFAAGQVTRQGSVDSGNSISDYDPIEIARKISINTSLLHCISGGTKINMLDTPGYADFIVELRNAVPAAEAGIVVISGVDGIEVGTQRAWGILDANSLPRAIFINKLDKDNSDFYGIVDTIRAVFGDRCTPVFLPIGSISSFKGIISLLSKSGWSGLSAEQQAEAGKYREKLVEIIAESDDALVEKYLGGEELSDAEIDNAFKTALKQQQIVPIFCGNPLAQLGIKELISAIIAYFPAAASTTQVDAFDARTKEKKTVIADSSRPFSAFVFKTISDPYVGQLSLFRVVSGVLNSNTEFFNVEQDTAERFGQIYIMQGKEQLSVESVCAGDIAAVAKLKNTHTGDSLTDAKHPLLFNKKVFMEPAISFSLKPKTRQDEEKISQSLAKMTTEDQGLRVSRDSQTKELILSGMGDMHLEIAIERLKQRYHVEVEVGMPKVPYKETIKKSTKIHQKYKKQSGGRGQYADVWLELHPLARGQEFVFLDKVVGGVVPRQYIPSVEKGVRKALGGGAIAGYPLVDLSVTIFDGSYHEVDSSDMAFQIAAGMALRKGVVEASPILLEPLMDVEIVIPDEYMGAINGDLSSRRGRVQGMELSGKYEKIKAQVPLSEMLRYATELRSMTQGRGSYSMTFSHYEEVPGRIAEKIIAQAKFEHEHEE